MNDKQLLTYILSECLRLGYCYRSASGSIVFSVDDDFVKEVK